MVHTYIQYRLHVCTFHIFNIYVYALHVYRIIQPIVLTSCLFSLGCLFYRLRARSTAQGNLQRNKGLMPFGNFRCCDDLLTVKRNGIPVQRTLLIFK